MKFEKKHWIYLAISVGVGLFTILTVYKTKIFDNIELLMLDQTFYMRDNATESKSAGEGAVQISQNKRLNKNIMIIGIDEQALAEYGQFPWNRGTYAKFLDHVGQANPSIVFFDIFFTEPGRSAGEDAALIAGLARNKDLRVVVDYPLNNEHDFNMDLFKERYDLLLKTSFDANETAENVSDYRNAAIPLQEVLLNIDDAAEAVIEPDLDNKVRRAPLALKFKSRLYPFIALSLTRQYLGVSRENVSFDLGNHIGFKDAKIPMLNDFGEITGYETRDILIPCDKSGNMLINYVGYPGEFKSQLQYLSFSEAMLVDPATFDGKILMVGAYAQGMAQDLWPSPHGNMYGIEHNANAVNTILNQDFLYMAPWWVNVLIIALICLLIGLVIPRLSMLLATIVSVAIFIVFEIVTLIVFIGMNTILLYFAPVVALILSFAGIIIFRVLTEEKEKQFIKKRFANYVNASVVEELLKNPKALQLGGEKKYLTVLFSDVRGFTTISEKLGDPQLLVALLNEYLGAMTEIIFAYDGTLDKYVGDEIMAFWGAPVPQADHHLRACKTAIDQMYYLKHVLNPRLRAEGRPELDIGIGVNTGIMTVGNMGSKNRMDYTLMGDNVNLGARLEGTNKIYGSHIIISEFTYSDVKDQVIVRELDNIKVKGKSKPVRIYELIEVIGHDPEKSIAKLSENK